MAMAMATAMAMAKKACCVSGRLKIYIRERGHDCELL